MASENITPILMPKWGLAMQEGRLNAWHVAEGAQIAPGDEIMDVETDKIANVVEAADGGLLRRRVADEGEVYPVQALLGVMAPEEVGDAELDAYIAAYEVPKDAGGGEDAGPAYLFAELDVGRVRYAARGTGTGDDGKDTPVILVHGFGGDLDNWLFTIDALAEVAPVYAPDLPGHGQSVKAVAEPDLDLLSQCVIGLMDHLSVTRAHLVGHSMGGAVCAMAAAAHPDRVASLALIGSAGLGTDINGAYIDGFVGAADRRSLKPVLTQLFRDESLVSRAMVADLLKYKRLDGVQEFLSALAGKIFADGRQQVQIVDQLRKADVPTLIIWGADDAVIPASHANGAEGATVHVLPDAGHMVQMEQAARVNELLKSQL